MEDEIKRKVLNHLEFLEKEIDGLQKKEKKRGKRGVNPIIKRIRTIHNSLKIVIIGQDCEYIEGNYCHILKTSCDLLNKKECPVRLKQIENEEIQGDKIIYSTSLKELLKKTKKHDKNEFPDIKQVLQEIKQKEDETNKT